MAVIKKEFRHIATKRLLFSYVIGFMRLLWISNELSSRSNHTILMRNMSIYTYFLGLNEQ